MPSLTALQVIAADLGVEVADFFPEERRHGTRLIRAADRHEFRLEQGSGEVYAVLAGQVADRAFSALYARHLPANGGSERPFRHLDEEFSLILSGTLELTIEGETYERVTGPLCQRLSHVAASHRRWAGAGRGATCSRSRERSRPGFRAGLARECACRRPRDCRSSGWRARTEPAAVNGEMPFQVAVIQFAGARSRVTRSVAPGLIGAVRRCGRWEAIISAAASSNVSRATSAVRRRATTAVHSARCAIIKPCSPGVRTVVNLTGKPTRVLRALVVRSSITQVPSSITPPSPSSVSAKTPPSTIHSKPRCTTCTRHGSPSSQALPASYGNDVRWQIAG